MKRRALLLQAGAAVAAAALLAGCASWRATDASWTTGRISVRVDASAAHAAQSVSAGFELRGNGEFGELRLDTPMGLRIASARWSPGAAQLTGSDGDHSYDSLDALSRDVLGEVLPLAALPDWVAGRPWPAASWQKTDDGFEQLGWFVVLTRRSEGWIEARRDTAPKVLMRMIIDH